MTSWYYCAIFHFVAEEKKKRRKKKNKGILLLGYHRYPSKKDAKKTKAFYYWAITGIQVKNDNSPSHSTVCSREGSNQVENRSLVTMLIGGPENVQTAECTRRFNAKIGPSLFHSLFQRGDLCDNNNVIVLTAYGRIPMDKRNRHYHQTNDSIQAQS